MSTNTTHHDICVAAPAQRVFDVIAEVGDWPLHFPPTIKAEKVRGDDRDETIRLWAMAEGRIRTWESERTLDREALGVVFRQGVPAKPLAAMTGEWRIAVEEGGVRVTLLHEFSVIGDDPHDIKRVEDAVEANSTAELANLKVAAEREEDLAALRLDFTDVLTVPGTDIHSAREFIVRADLWPERLGHVQSLDLSQDEDGRQVIQMSTRGQYGEVHTTVSGRVCQPGGSVTYKQTRPPTGLAAHCGEWTFEQTAGRVQVGSRHRVLLDQPVLARNGMSVEQARKAVREALGGNSRATLAALAQHLQNAHPERKAS